MRRGNIWQVADGNLKEFFVVRMMIAHWFSCLVIIFCNLDCLMMEMNHVFLPVIDLLFGGGSFFRGLVSAT